MLRLFRANSVPDRHEETTSWLELLCDLVYIAILVKLDVSWRMRNRLVGQEVSH